MKITAKKVAVPGDVPAELELETGGTVKVDFPAEPESHDGAPEMQWVAARAGDGGSVATAGSTVTLTGLNLTSGHEGTFEVPVGSDVRFELPANPMRFVGLKAADGATVTIEEEAVAKKAAKR